MSLLLNLNHISIQVSDLAASSRFYSEVLGLREIENKTGFSFVRWFGIGDTHAIHLIGGQGTEQTAPKATHFALTTDDLEGAMSRLTDAGVPFGDYAGQAGKVGVRGDGARSIYFQDPDHHWIEIVDAGTL